MIKSKTTTGSCSHMKHSQNQMSSKVFTIKSLSIFRTGLSHIKNILPMWLLLYDLDVIRIIFLFCDHYSKDDLMIRYDFFSSRIGICHFRRSVSIISDSSANTLIGLQEVILISIFLVSSHDRVSRATYSKQIFLCCG